MMNSRRSDRLYPFDWLILGYCGLMMLLLALFGRPVSRYVDEFVTYAGVMTFSLLIIWFVDEHRGRLHAFFRLLYPLFLFGLFYRTAGGVVHLFFDEFLDWQLTTLERMILGVNPTLYIDQHLLNVWVNELFSFCYFSYYLMIPGLMLPLFYFRKYEIVKKALTATCLAFFISYIMFMLYPIEGPRWYFAQDFARTIDGFMFRSMTQLVISKGAFHGGCMPSSHVAVALVVWLVSFRHFRVWGWILLPINIGLAIGTVWGRYHYASDVMVGAAIGLFATTLVWKYYDRWSQPADASLLKMELTEEHVS